jgi:hypothetical protein
MTWWTWILIGLGPCIILFIRRIKGTKAYITADIIGRNDPCWCGSNKKYKRCHLHSDEKHFKSPTIWRNYDSNPQIDPKDTALGEQFGVPGVWWGAGRH